MRFYVSVSGRFSCGCRLILLLFTCAYICLFFSLSLYFVLISALTNVSVKFLFLLYDIIGLLGFKEFRHSSLSIVNARFIAFVFTCGLYLVVGLYINYLLLFVLCCWRCDSRFVC